jgi:ribosomal protein L37E
MNIINCKICEKSAKYIGKVDFNKSGNDFFEGRRLFPISKENVSYHRCTSCGFMFSTFLDDWCDESFKKNIYNCEYIKADPPFEYERPKYNSEIVSQYFNDFKENFSILDYGSGSKKLEKFITEKGFKCSSYDPFYNKGSPKDGSLYDLVLCFEVIEHATNQSKIFNDILSFLEQDGILLFSTLLQPDDITKINVNWHYVCPRNGHVSFHTKDSLKIILNRFGYKYQSINEEYHVAYKNKLKYIFPIETINKYRNYS